MKTRLLFITSIIGTLIFSTCNPPEFNICEPDELIAPELGSPHLYTIASTLPTFKWSYAEECIPESYQLEVKLREGHYAGETTSTSRIVMRAPTANG